MECHLDLNEKSRDRQSSRTIESTIQPRASQSMKLQEKLKTGKHGMSYPDLHNVVNENVQDVPPRSSRNQQKQQISKKATREEELVKYMSSVPSYLERGEKPQEKVFNIGVLDWGLLEKWQHGQKQMPCTSSRSSVCSNASLYFSTDGSFTHSIRGRSSSPSRRMTWRPSLQQHLMASPTEDHSSATSSHGDVGKFHDLKAAQSNTVSEKLNFIGTDQLLTKKHEIKPGQDKNKVTKPNIERDTRSMTKKVSYEVVSSPKEKMKTQDDNFGRTKHLQDPKANDVSQDVPEKKNQSALCQVSGQGSTNESKIKFPDRSKQACHSELKSNSNAENIKFKLARRQPISRSAEIGVGLSKGRNILEKSSTITHPTSTGKESSNGLDMKASKAAAEKPRSISLFRGFSIGMGNTSKTSEGKDGLNAASVPAKSVSENYTTLDCSSNGKSSSSGKNKSIPLRRLFDPLMKPKVANNRQLAEPSQKDSISTDCACRKLDLNGCKGTNVNDSCQGKKHGSSNLQALLRFSIKNELPIFTFAVDNDSDIFAATMKLSTSMKDEHSCIYTFFTVKEVKKKRGGWISQDAKGKSHGYIPDAVAQMKVFDTHLSNLTRQNFSNHSRVKEFVLFSVELREGDQGTSNFQPADELAAIVVKMPKRMHRKAGSNQPLVNNQEGIRTTVILPSGSHSLPSKGEPSSLVQRWRTRGSCDCGGWDLGCKLKILVNPNLQLAKKSSSSSIKDQFVLFSQDGAEENRPALSLSPLEDGIFSIEFNSSLTYLQAFSTCIAMLDGRNMCNLSESKDLFEENIFARNDGTKNGNQAAEGEAPVRYVSHPPLSPVGRV